MALGALVSVGRLELHYWHLMRVNNVVLLVRVEASLNFLFLVFIHNATRVFKLAVIGPDIDLG